MLSPTRITALFFIAVSTFSCLPRSAPRALRADIPIGALVGAPGPIGLCTEDERVLFSCPLRWIATDKKVDSPDGIDRKELVDAGGRILSVCGSRDLGTAPGWVQLRYGTADHLELLIDQRFGVDEQHSTGPFYGYSHQSLTFEVDGRTYALDVGGRGFGPSGRDTDTGQDYAEDSGLKRVGEYHTLAYCDENARVSYVTQLAPMAVSGQDRVPLPHPFREK